MGLWAAWSIALVSCAPSEPPARTVLVGEEPSHLDLGDPSRESLAPRGAISLPYRTPDAGGTAYRLILELSGERWTAPSSMSDPPEPLGESHLLELEYTERPIEGAGAVDDAYLLVLDALHYKLLQRNPNALREIELGNDRFHMFSDGEEVWPCVRRSILVTP